MTTIMPLPFNVITGNLIPGRHETTATSNDSNDYSRVYCEGFENFDWRPYRSLQIRWQGPSESTSIFRLMRCSDDDVLCSNENHCLRIESWQQNTSCRTVGGIIHETWYEYLGPDSYNVTGDELGHVVCWR